jgi:hypothetical protein
VKARSETLVGIEEVQGFAKGPCASENRLKFTGFEESASLGPTQYAFDLGGFERRELFCVQQGPGFAGLEKALLGTAGAVLEQGG